MKNPLDPRHKKRETAIRYLFCHSFQKKPTTSPVAKSVLDNLRKIDNAIKKAAPEWPLPQINRIDLAILRLAVYELLIDKHEPTKVVIDEAIELAKKYGSEKSPAFINGALGAILKKYHGL